METTEKDGNSGRGRSDSVSYNKGGGSESSMYSRGKSESVSHAKGGGDESTMGRSESNSSNSSGSSGGSMSRSSSDGGQEERLGRLSSGALADVTSFRVDKLDFNLPPIMQMQANSSPTSGGHSSRTENQDHYQPMDELLRVRFQMEELKQRKETLEEEVQKWAIVHKSISNLYLEVSNKILDDAKREEEKSNLENLEIMVIVDYIRTELRGLMGVKAEFDKEILIELDKKQAEFDRQLDAERKKLADSAKLNEELQQKLDQTNAQLKEINTAKAQDMQEASQHQKQIEEELQATKELIQQKDSGMEEKQIQLAKLYQLIKTKDSKLTKLSELEARIQHMASLHDSERQQHQIEVQKLKDKCAALTERANYTAEAKKKLEDELKTITERMIDIKKHNYFNDYTEAAKRLDRLTHTSETQVAQLRRTEEEVKKFKQLNEELSSKMKELEREFGRSQFSSVPSIKKKEKAKAISEEQYRKVVNESPHYVDAYKSLLREKEAQIKDLTAKLRTLLVQANVSVKRPSSTGARRQLTASEPPANSRVSDSPSSSPEQWVSKQIQIMQKATTYAPQKNKDIGTNSAEGSEAGEEDMAYDDGGSGREKWMQGLKTPNMRTIKILKSPSEKELSVISRNPLFNNAADVSKQYIKPQNKRTGLT